jgi:hypothetical protein
MALGRHEEIKRFTDNLNKKLQNIFGYRLIKGAGIRFSIQYGLKYIYVG